ncbi:MAG: translation initiation factor IF-2 [Candidatus Syntrophoarchaeum caldarius]|uniref:Probable translation initiation factor IF-2 n=1 Tax=Candidatus Syntropharchaeum caldarium TaxID=1838285 RepID=A0A1F2PBS0_9EURY|nr:MAG: translation initiation factor IF-2 [Candidatus Syntrophoarchaeum caldarius]
MSVMGHVDHGKTLLLDQIRGSTIVDREAGRITQHIGATEVPIATITKICAPLTKLKFEIPGLLFIDTPGHHAFTTLRSRGGALSDIAVVVVDILEGFRPQTIETINILKRFRTPFVVACNKIDRISGWIAHPSEPFITSYKKQRESVQTVLDEKIYEIVGSLHEQGFSSDRYDRITDFQRNIGIIPTSAMTGEGIPDLLLVLIGLAQKFLEDSLHIKPSNAGVGTILEVKEEKGLGITLDVILYDGTIKTGDKIVVGSLKEPIVTHVKALLKPRPLQEIRMEERFKSVRYATAAAGVKVAAPNLEGALAGLPVRVVADDADLEEIIADVSGSGEIKIEQDPIGIIIKADTLGSLEALAHELREAEIPIQSAEVGDISRRDVINASTIKDPLLAVILGFNVDILPDALDEIMKEDVAVFTDTVIYGLLDSYEEWAAAKREEIKAAKFGEVTRPGIVELLPGCVFRQSKPAVVGVKVIHGTIKPNVTLIKADGKRIGVVKGLQSAGEDIGMAKEGMEFALAIEGPTVGRQINVGDRLFVELSESDARLLDTERDSDILDESEIKALDEFLRIKRRDDPFWGK